VTLLGFVLAELEALVEEQPARATAPAVRNPGDQEQLATP
jgi:hypothetical protein